MEEQVKKLHREGKSVLHIALELNMDPRAVHHIIYNG